MRGKFGQWDLVLGTFSVNWDFQTREACPRSVLMNTSRRRRQLVSGPLLAQNRFPCERHDLA